MEHNAPTVRTHDIVSINAHYVTPNGEDLYGRKGFVQAVSHDRVVVNVPMPGISVRTVGLPIDAVKVTFE